MARNKNLIILLITAAILALAIFGHAQGWLPLKIGENKSAVKIEAPVVANLKVKLEVSGKTYQTEVKPGATAYNLMKKLEASQGLKFSAKEYSGLGAMIEEINGVKNDLKANKFWIFYLNGQSSTVGVSGYVLKNNDVINWKYESYKF